VFVHGQLLTILLAKNLALPKKYVRPLRRWLIDLRQHAGTICLLYSLQRIAAIHQDMTEFVFPLLRFLADNRFHSFDEIRNELGLSPSEVSRALAYLAIDGIEAEEVERRGCRLTTPFSALDAAEVGRLLGENANMFAIDVVDQTGSTNDDLMLRSRQGAPAGLVRVAETQTAGRGRRQRNWYSAPGGALTFSLLWAFDSGAQALSGLPLAVGVSLVRSLHALKVRGVQLKWPNDLLWQQRKLGGVLIETSGSAQGVVNAVIGVGLNLRLTRHVVERIDQPAADLESAGLRVGRNELLARLLLDLRDVLGTFSREGFRALRSEWERLHAYRDKMVRLDMAGETCLEGRVIGVDEYGALLLETGSGIRAFHSGELSLRLAGS
jgi:BirA family biotin operon repressor/biotin-[acetyl-CoA-carboxylase] ligase